MKKFSKKNIKKNKVSKKRQNKIQKGGVFNDSNMSTNIKVLNELMHTINGTKGIDIDYDKPFNTVYELLKKKYETYSTLIDDFNTWAKVKELNVQELSWNEVRTQAEEEEKAAAEAKKAAEEEENAEEEEKAETKNTISQEDIDDIIKKSTEKIENENKENDIDIYTTSIDKDKLIRIPIKKIDKYIQKDKIKELTLKETLKEIHALENIMPSTKDIEKERKLLLINAEREQYIKDHKQLKEYTEKEMKETTDLSFEVVMNGMNIRHKIITKFKKNFEDFEKSYNLILNHTASLIDKLIKYNNFFIKQKLNYKDMVDTTKIHIGILEELEKLLKKSAHNTNLDLLKIQQSKSEEVIKTNIENLNLLIEWSKTNITLPNAETQKMFFKVVEDLEDLEYNKRNETKLFNTNKYILYYRVLIKEIIKSKISLGILEFSVSINRDTVEDYLKTLKVINEDHLKKIKAYNRNLNETNKNMMETNIYISKKLIDKLEEILIKYKFLPLSLPLSLPSPLLLPLTFNY